MRYESKPLERKEPWKKIGVIPSSKLQLEDTAELVGEMRESLDRSIKIACLGLCRELSLFFVLNHDEIYEEIE